MCRMLDAHNKIEWISAGDKQFRALEQERNLMEKTVMQLRDMDPWEFEVALLFLFRCILKPCSFFFTM
jgi:hypothetical protein